MIRRVALVLNVLVILSGFGFALYHQFIGMGAALLLGGLHVMMLRPQDKPAPALLPIAVSLLMLTVGIQGTVLGVAYLLGKQQPGVDLELQHTTGRVLIALCPLFFTAAMVSLVEFVRRTLAAGRGRA